MLYEANIGGFSCWHVYSGFYTNWDIIQNRFENHQIVLLQVNGVAAGFVCWYGTNSVVFIDIVEVRPEMRRCGLGRFMVEECLHKLGEMGCVVVGLECPFIASLPFWRRLEFLPNIALVSCVNERMYKVLSTSVAQSVIENPNGCMIITANRVYLYDKNANALSDDSLQFASSDIKVLFAQSKVTWLQLNGAWKCYSPRGPLENPNLPFLGLFDKINDIFFTTGNTLYLVNGYNEILRIVNPERSVNLAAFSLLVKSVKDGNGILLDLDNIDLNYSNNALRITIAAPSFMKERSAEFQYQIEGMMNHWSEWSRTPVLEFPFFPSGRYKLKIRARDVLGNESQEYSLNFRVQPPFWKSIWFISLCILLLLFIMIVFVRVRERNLIRDKIVLEQKVRMRTQTIEDQRMEMENQRDSLALQNEEIMQQKEEIETQRDEIENQRDQIVKQNENITKSIEYAKRIQTAAMGNTII